MTPAPREAAARDRPEGRTRSRAAGGMALFCAAAVIFLVVGDLTIPEVTDTEVWLGFELRGAAARLTAPLHWAIFAFGAWGFWRETRWIWTAAIAYAATIAISHVVWNFTSPNGGGAPDAVFHGVLFSVPMWLLACLQPPHRSRAAQVGRVGLRRRT